MPRPAPVEGEPHGGPSPAGSEGVSPARDLTPGPFPAREGESRVRKARGARAALHTSQFTLHTSLSWAAVGLITLLALGLRLFAIGHGLPEQYVPDESTMVGGALRMGASRSLYPGTFIYPAGLMYLFAAEYLGLLVVGSLTHTFASVDQFKEFAFVDPTLFYLLPRIAIALIGTACVPAVFLLGRRLYGNVAGVAASFLVAASVMHVQMSHQARHWVPIALFTLLIMWVSLDIREHGRRRDYLLSGLLVGLAFATSFNGILLIALPLVAHLQRVIERARKGGSETSDGGARASSPVPLRSGSATPGGGGQATRPTDGGAGMPPGTGEDARAPLNGLLSPRLHLPMIVAVVMAPVLFFALNPYILLRFNEFAAFQTSGERSIGGQILGHYDSYLQQFLARQGFTFYAEATLAYEPAITILGIVGAVLAVRRFRQTAPLVLSYPVFHYLMFSTTAPSMEQRYMLPAVVLLALPAGLAVSIFAEWFARGNSRSSQGTPAGSAGVSPAPGRRGTSRPPYRATAAIVVLASLVLLPALRYDWVLAQPDTRTISMNWIQGNIPAGSDVAVEGYGPPLAPDLDTLRAQQQAQPGSLGNRDQWVLEKGLPEGEIAYRLTRLNLVDTSPAVDNVTQYLQTHTHRYFVVSDFRWKSDHLGHQALKDYLAHNGRLVKAFYPSPDSAYVPSDLLNNLEDPLYELFKVDRPGPRIEIFEVSR